MNENIQFHVNEKVFELLDFSNHNKQVTLFGNN